MCARVEAGGLRNVVGVVGYQGSGKTTLIRALAHELIGRGRRVAVVKHISHRLDLSGKDTAMLGEVVGQVGFISPQESGIFWRGTLSLEELVFHLQADVILVEGFKAERGFPKVVCLRGEPDDLDLLDDWAMCAVEPVGGLPSALPLHGGPGDDTGPSTMWEAWGEEGIPLLSRDEVGRIADLVEQRLFGS